MTGLILAAGLGERLHSSKDYGLCKPLQKVSDIPLISYSLELLEKTDVEDVIIVVGKYYEQIRSEIGDSFGKMKIRYELQQEQKGLVNAIVCGCRNCEDDVLVLLADELFVEAKIDECLSVFSDDSLDFVCTYTIEDDEEKIKANFSFRTDENGIPYDFVEKPTETVNDMKGTGVCLFSRESIKKVKQKYDEESNTPNTLCDFFNMLLEEKMTGKAFNFAKAEINVNTQADLSLAKSMFETEE
ncbi:MAG: NTP transferase domain-containing protein [Clostridia bacterium]|nr:NTP transferase domain-containing protein [Clostridia bacterium]